MLHRDAVVISSLGSALKLLLWLQLQQAFPVQVFFGWLFSCRCIVWIAREKISCVLNVLPILSYFVQSNLLCQKLRRVGICVQYGIKLSELAYKMGCDRVKNRSCTAWVQVQIQGLRTHFSDFSKTSASYEESESRKYIYFSILCWDSSFLHMSACYGTHIHFKDQTEWFLLLSGERMLLHLSSVTRLDLACLSVFFLISPLRRGLAPTVWTLNVT